MNGLVRGSMFFAYGGRELDLLGRRARHWPSCDLPQLFNAEIEPLGQGPTRHARCRVGCVDTLPSPPITR